MKIRIHAYVEGNVQGVFFRSNTRNIARNLNLTGFVKNLQDGRVEVVAEGEEEKINKLIEFLKQGPEFAKVRNVDIKKEKYSGEFEDFEVKY
ncbi:MAG: acylphosphatase [Candidatus Aenigmarchaeota archaeon]|nr:acylphosphatase [Candidatus Aenigmarchaeota archaeon]